MAITVVATAIGGCSDTDDEPAGGTVATAATTTTTDPYAVPEVIDVAYVNRVLAGLDAAVGDVVRLVVRTRSIPPEAVDRLRALYADEEARNLQIENFDADVQRGFSGYRTDPGNQRTTALELVSASPSCIYARVERDFSEVGSAPTPASSEWVGLKPSNQVSTYNPTNWMIVTEGFRPDGSAPPNPCAAG